MVLASIALGQDLAAWSFVLATSLLSAFVGGGNRRLFSPVHIAMWFFGVSIAAWVGAWGPMSVYLAATCVAAPYALLALFATRRANAGTPAFDAESACAEDATLRLIAPADAQDADALLLHAVPYRRSA